MHPYLFGTVGSELTCKAYHPLKHKHTHTHTPTQPNPPPTKPHNPLKSHLVNIDPLATKSKGIDILYVYVYLSRYVYMSRVRVRETNSVDASK